MPHCDVTAGHYYSQLMTTAHPSCHWPATARFTEHGQHAEQRPMLGNHGHCPASDNIKVGLNNPDHGKMICPRPYIEHQNVINFKNSVNLRILTHFKMPTNFNEKIS